MSLSHRANAQDDATVAPGCLLAWMRPALALTFACTISSIVTACSHAAPAHSPASAQGPAPSTPRIITARAQLPDIVRERLPAHGVYVWLAGEAAAAFITLDRDSGTLRQRTHHHGRPDNVKEHRLGSSEVQRLWALAETAWREPAAPPHEPVLDYNEALAIGDGGDAYYLEGHGSIEQPAAAAVVKALADAAR